jgi:hypothetical protein
MASYFDHHATATRKNHMNELHLAPDKRRISLQWPVSSAGIQACAKLPAYDDQPSRPRRVTAAARPEPREKSVLRFLE